MTLVLGVDGCLAGWLGISFEVERDTVRPLDARLYAAFQEVLLSDAAVVCIDIPIGLPFRSEHRLCDRQARAKLAKRGCCVFSPPCREALYAPDFKTASEVSFAFLGRKITIQAWGIMPKIREMDALMTPQLQDRVREVHPELCFWSLNDRSPLLTRKKRSTGSQARWNLLGPALPGLTLGPALPPGIPGCSLDDYIDALAAACTAVSILRGTATRIPDEPDIDARGLRMEMWYPAP